MNSKCKAVTINKINRNSVLLKDFEVGHLYASEYTREWPMFKTMDGDSTICGLISRDDIVLCITKPTMVDLYYVACQILFKDKIGFIYCETDATIEQKYRYRKI
jgi:hypothetical protein